MMKAFCFMVYVLGTAMFCVPPALQVNGLINLSNGLGISLIVGGFLLVVGTTIYLNVRYKKVEVGGKK